MSKNPERQVLWWHLLQKWNTQMEKPMSRRKHAQSTVTPYSIWSAASNNRLARKLKSLQMFYLCCEKTCSKHLCWVTGLQPRSCSRGKRKSRAPLSSYTVPASNSSLVQGLPLLRYLVRNLWGDSWEGPQQRNSGIEPKCSSAEPAVMSLGTLYTTSALIARGILWDLVFFQRGA